MVQIGERMKVATVPVAGERRVGQIAQDGMSIAPFGLALSETRDGILALIGRNGAGIPPTLSPISLSQAAIEAPIPVRRRNIFCVGEEYHEHAHKFARSGFDSGGANGAVAANRVVFSEMPESVTVRYSRWLIGKSQDMLCPMGPFAVTRDEIDIANTSIKCSVNGGLRESSNTDIANISETLPAGITLQPGDIVATRTSAGVGIGFDPPKYVKGGDVVRIEIGGIGGALENEIAERTT